ncbi:MAG: hypothetical protein QNJ78_08610 [Gammaproteobacteria bacterium]|nr:hypothetical protein [Gammaproteobacteria bacterium]
MKFPHLPIGQRFSFKGKTYTKTGPLTASEEETGKRQLMRKSAEVTPLNLTQTASEQKERQFGEREVREMFARYREQLHQAVSAKAGQQASLSIEQLLALLDAQPLPIDQG